MPRSSESATLGSSVCCHHVPRAASDIRCREPRGEEVENVKISRQDADIRKANKTTSRGAAILASSHTPSPPLTNANMINLVPDKVSSHPQYPRLVQAVRICQFIFAIVNIGIFAAYIVRTSVRISNASGAVVGILAAAIAFSIIATIVSCTKAGKYNRTAVIIFFLDLLFVAAFIAVSVLTAMARSRPAGPGRGSCAMSGDSEDDGDDGDDDDDDEDESTGMMRNCNLTSASLALSIVST